MSIWKGITIAGIWIGVGIASFSGIDGDVIGVSFFFAAGATMIVALLGGD